MALSGHDEICGDELGALVQQLEKGVLSVGGRLAEEDRASGVLDVFTCASNRLPVRLHRELLEIRREAVEILIKSAMLVLCKKK